MAFCGPQRSKRSAHCMDTNTDDDLQQTRSSSSTYTGQRANLIALDIDVHYRAALERTTGRRWRIEFGTSRSVREHGPSPSHEVALLFATEPAVVRETARALLLAVSPVQTVVVHPTSSPTADDDWYVGNAYCVFRSGWPIPPNLLTRALERASEAA